MALLISLSSLQSHLYQQIIDEITRSRPAIAENAIRAAIDESKSYLNQFHLPSIFGTPDTNPTVTDYNLKNKVTDIAVWHLIKLSSPNISYEAAQHNYEYAIKWLRDVQAGKATPDGWTYKDTSTDPVAPQGNALTWDSNRKRAQHF